MQPKTIAPKSLPTDSEQMGAFGMLSSQEVQARGSINNFLLDQAFALSWTQRYISFFGGDPEQVTVSGQSAGAGSVMYHAMAGGGDLKQKLFRYVCSSSGMQHRVTA